MKLTRKSLAKLVKEEIELYMEEDSPEQEFLDAEEEANKKMLAQSGKKAVELAKIVKVEAEKEAEALGAGFDPITVERFLIGAMNKALEDMK